ncbi:MAG TPA: DMT family transporter [Emcibacteraceae bacterium]|nr:DMT family transporter [Emcibacteraceae bacterium]HRW30607.1 DMT family transporter [Emcibacteraceae bacterium]
MMPTIKSTRENSFKGILFVLAFCLIVTASASLIKKLGQDLNTFEVVMIRCTFTVIITLIFNLRLGRVLFITTHPKLMAYRSALTWFVVVSNFYAVSRLPLVEVTSLQFSKPLFLIILAALFLGEKIRFRRTTATIFGFIGILIILHPWDNASSGGLKWAHLSILASSFSMAVLAIMSKMLTKNHNPTTMVLYANSATVLLCALPAAYYWITPTPQQLLLIAGLGITTFCAQYSMISAYKYADVTLVTPFEYLRIIFAALAGYLIFSELPDIWTVSGGIIICSSTLFIAYREAIKNRSKTRNI